MLLIKHLKKIVLLACLPIFLIAGAPTSNAATTFAAKCNYDDAEIGKNPSNQTINCLLTEIALAYDVPPEIVKGIAKVETDWRQFDREGNPIVSDDGGIGIMQITLYQDYDIERLKHDIVYNIQAGVEMLNSMFSRKDLPTVNNGERDYLEHWYFALLAYNGTKPVNSPIVQQTGERNLNAYQEKVFSAIAQYHLLQINEIAFHVSDFQYNPDSSESIQFVTKQFESGKTETSYHLKSGDRAVVTSDRVNLRATPSTEHIVGHLAEGEIVTIDGSYRYDENKASLNHFVWYPITRADGTKGYVASSYLQKTEEVPLQRFTDVPENNWAAKAIYFLTDKEVIKGYPDGSFGFHDFITRGQAAVMLARAEQLAIGNYPPVSFTDVEQNHPYFNEISAVVHEGIFTGVTATTFEPNANLTRAQMAVLLDRLYHFSPVAGYEHPFTDVVQESWYEQAVSTLAGNGIVAGEQPTKFAPQSNVTRAQFAVFMARALDETFRTN